VKAVLCAALMATLLLPGCASRYQVSASSNTSNFGSPASGTTVTSTQSGLRVESGPRSIAAALLVIGILASTMDYVRDPQPFPSPSVMFPIQPLRDPELAPARRVTEHDCTKPVEDWSANLKCR
jgi:hypothetical protein